MLWHGVDLRSVDLWDFDLMFYLVYHLFHADVLLTNQPLRD